MPSFKAGGREWLVSIDAPKIRRVRESCKVDLGARNASQFQQLSDDPLLAGQVLWQLCRQQAEAVGISEEAFESLLSGDDGEAAGMCLVEAIIDFFPTRQQKLLREMLATEQAVSAARVEAAESRIRSPETLEALRAKAIREVNESFDQMLAKTSLSSATGSQAQ
jgi:hypothetical protein